MIANLDFVWRTQTNPETCRLFYFIFFNFCIRNYESESWSSTISETYEISCKIFWKVLIGLGKNPYLLKFVKILEINTILETFLKFCFCFFFNDSLKLLRLTVSFEREKCCFTWLLYSKNHCRFVYSIPQEPALNILEILEIFRSICLDQQINFVQSSV